MKIKDAASRVSNQVSDICSTGEALIACVKQIANDPQFKHPLRDVLVNTTHRFESILNRDDRR